MTSRPLAGRRLGISLLLDPRPHVGERELEVLAETMGTRAGSASAPVVDGRDRQAQIGGQFVHVDQRLQPESFAESSMSMRIGTALLSMRSVITANDDPPSERMPVRVGRNVVLDDLFDDLVMSHQLESPGNP